MGPFETPGQAARGATTEAVQSPTLGGDPFINITGDAEFLAMAASEGWSGDGSAADPYVIEGYVFNGTMTEHALNIVDVGYRFTVRGNRFEGGNATALAFWEALYLQNVTCEVSGNWFGPYSRECLQFRESSVVVRNNTLRATGRILYGTGSVSRIETNRFEGEVSTAVDLDSGSSEIAGNTMVGRNCTGTGIRAIGISNSNISRNNISGFGTGIQFSPATFTPKGIMIGNNTLTGCRAGIGVNNTDDVSIVGNSISPDEGGSLMFRGIFCGAVLNLDCRGNNLSRCGIYPGTWKVPETHWWRGYTIDPSNTIDSVPVLFAHDTSGLILDGTRSEYIIINCTNVTMADRSVRGPYFGVLAFYVSDLGVTGNTIGTTMQNTIHLYYPTRATIARNQLLNNTVVSLSSGDTCEISNNTISNGSIVCGSSESIVVADNSLGNTTVSNAISLGRLLGSTIVNNEVRFRAGVDYTSGFRVYGTVASESFGTIKGNELWNGGGFLIEGINSIDVKLFDVDDTNTVDGRPVAFREGQDGLDLSGDYAQVILVSCKNATIHGLEFNRSTYAVQLTGCTNVTVSNCTFRDTMYCAASFDHAGYSTFTDNTIVGGKGWVDLDTCPLRIERNVVENVSLKGQQDSVAVFMLYNSDRSIFDRNVVDGTDMSGVSLMETHGCTFTNNTIRRCGSYAIRLVRSCTENRFYLNTFVENNRKVGANGTAYYEQVGYTMPYTEWDNGAYGNYWSDYEDRYPTAKNDGYIWDTPYGYGTGTAMFEDRFPLAVPYDYTPPVVGAMDDIYIDQHGTAHLVANATDDVDIEDCTWTFEVGGKPVILDGMDASYRFDLAGQFQVELVVMDHWKNAGAGGLTVFVNDTEPPVISGVGDLVALQGAVAVLDSSGCTDNVGIGAVSWSFLYDGRPVDLRTRRAEFRFDLAGEYLVTLDLWDLSGNHNSTTFNVTVLDSEPPVARLCGDLEVDQGTTLTFTGLNSSDNLGIVRYEWHLTSEMTGDVVREGVEFTYSFSLAGDYLINLTVADAAGLEGVATVRVRALDTEPPVAWAGEDVTVEPGTKVAFDMSRSADNVGIAGWTWSLVYDGRPWESHDTVFTFTFLVEGQYKVVLTVQDARGNEGRDEVLVRVQDTHPPVAVAGPDISIDQHQEAALDGSGSSDDRGVVGWTWTFEYGGGTQSVSGARANFVFDEAGDYALTLTVMDAAGNTATDSLMVRVRDVTPPHANAGPDRTVNQSVACVLDGGLSSDNVAILSYSWTFEYGGRQMSLQGRTVEFTFDVPGAYTVTLRVADGEGLESVDALLLTVRDTERPVARFTMDPDDLKAEEGATLAFDGSGSTDNVAVTEWTWTVAHDGTQETRHGRNLRYRFDGTGNYTVRLEVVDAAGLTDFKEVAIEVEKGPDDHGRLYLIFGTVGFIALLLVVVLVILARRRRARSQP